MINADIIADSITPHGHRCTSFVLTMPRIVLAEFNTHRMISRNSASSRAVPFDKMVERVQENPFIPIRWMKDHSGMQGDEYFTDEDQVKPTVYPVSEEGKNHYKVSDLLKANWLKARDQAVYFAKNMSELGLTKQFVNRLLEPFMWHTVIATATEWENFFALRAHEAAEIHIQKLAYMMLEEYNASEPKHLKPGQWHTPFGDRFDEARIDKLGFVKDNSPFYTGEHGKPDADEYIAEIRARKVAIATARCARVSYINYEGNDDYEADIKLHDRLAKLGHWSPFEHCARAMTPEEAESSIRHELSDGEDSFTNHHGTDVVETTAWSGNFRGFIQYRKMFEGENREDPRVELKRPSTIF